jgi:cardiolipin synthase (CMP-forming)
MLRHIPNALCVLRMLLVAPVAWLLVHDDFGSTLWVFGFAAVTDGLDGFLAKRFGWTSELGKILDPLADKILLVSVFLLLAYLGLVPIWLAAAAVARDVIITAGAIAYNSLYGYPNGRPTLISKLNTLTQIVYLLLMVAAHHMQASVQPLDTILGAFVFLFTVVSGLDYVITYSRKAIHASRQHRELAR